MIQLDHLLSFVIICYHNSSVSKVTGHFLSIRLADLALNT